jgi:hypothetical protein
MNPWRVPAYLPHLQPPLTPSSIERILGPDSELRELWEETDEFAEWQANLEQLRSALVV